MSLVFDLNKTEYIIDGDNKVFEDTGFEGLDFQVFVEPLTRQNFMRLRSKYTKIKKGIEVRQDDLIEKDLFMKQVKGWKNIKSSDKTEIICCDDTKQEFLSKKFFFCNLINAACLGFQLEVEEEKAVEKKI